MKPRMGRLPGCVYSGLIARGAGSGGSVDGGGPAGRLAPGGPAGALRGPPGSGVPKPCGLTANGPLLFSETVAGPSPVYARPGVWNVGSPYTRSYGVRV